jgi:hypothetical protein
MTIRGIAARPVLELVFPDLRIDQLASGDPASGSLTPHPHHLPAAIRRPARNEAVSCAIRRLGLESPRTLFGLRTRYAASAPGRASSVASRASR